MDRTKFIETAHKFKDMGFNPVCIYKPEKFPSNYPWRTLCTKRATDKDIHDMSNKYEPENLNIGIITGEISGVVVLDIDGEEGLEALKEHNIKLPDTLAVSTGRGYHYYFKYIKHPALKTRANYMPKVDIRTDGGLAVTPPSIHPDTNKPYEWISKAPIADFPEDLLQLFIQLSKQKKENDKGVPITEKATEGARNDTLFRVACAMHSMGFDEDIIKETILKQNERLPEPLSEKELEKTVFSSVFKYEISSEVRELNDYGNALRMRDLYKDQIVFIPERGKNGKWFIYKNGCWVEDRAKKTVYEKFVAMTHTIPKEIPQPSEDDSEAMKQYEKRLKFAKSCRNMSRITSGLKATQGLLSRSELSFDNNEWLFNVKNGTINLKDGTLYDHNPRDYLMKKSPVKYDPNATAPRWEQFLNEIFGDNDDIKKYIQKAVGYTLTGKNHEKAFFILYGSGDNGKSVFLDTIGYIMGDYYKKASFDTFTTKGKDKSVRNDLANLRGARIVVASETVEGDRLDESLIKDITGGEPITCRFLYAEDFQYVPEFKLWFSTNHKPRVRDDSNGMWNRIKLIPFTKTIPKEQQDKNLIDKLKAEASGILNWCLEGLALYLKEGLAEPRLIKDKVQEYREENDTFGCFLKETCTVNPKGRVIRKALFEAFQDWCEKTKSYPRGMGKITFYRKVRDRGFGEIKSNGERYFTGLEFKKHEAVSYREGNVDFIETHDGRF